MAEEAVTPISAAKPPAPANPLSPETAEHASTLKLKPVIRKPGTAGAPGGVSLLKRAPAPAPAAPSAQAPSAPAATSAPGASATAMDKLKNITQQLKGITSQLPQQAILHKTGIIADQNLTDAQKAASKSRTARISLSDAFGVAPVKDEGAPLKTIRIKRPENLQRHPAGSAAPGSGAPGLKPVPPGALKPVAPDASPAPAAGEEDTDTKRRTLKVTRPGMPGGEDTDTKRRTLKVARPSAKLAPRKAPASAPAQADAATGDDIPDIEDIPDIDEPPKKEAAKAGGVKDVPHGLLVFDMILQIAACVAMGILGWLLYTDWSIAWF